MKVAHGFKLKPPEASDLEAAIGMIAPRLSHAGLIALPSASSIGVILTVMAKQHDALSITRSRAFSYYEQIYWG